MGKIRKALRPTVFVLACLLVIAGPTLWLTPHVAKAYHRRQARLALARDDLDVAQVHLQHCLQVSSDDAELHFLYARICRRQDDVAGWQDHLRQSDRLGWSIDAIQLEEYLGQAQAGVLTVGEPPLLRFLEARHKDEALILEALAKGYLRNYRFQDVLRCAALWQKDYPDSWQPNYYRGQVFELLQRHDQAVDEYQAALTLSPHQPGVRLGLASVLALRGQFQEALEHFQAALQSNPHHPGALFGVAYCQRSIGDSEAARASLDTLLAQDPNHAAGLLLRGKLALDLQQPDEALVWLHRAEALNSQEPELAETLASCLRLLGRDSEAARYRQQAQELGAQQQRLEKIVVEISARPGDIALRYQAGVLLQGLGRYREAVHCLQSALELDPRHKPSQTALAECLDRLGKHRWDGL